MLEQGAGGNASGAATASTVVSHVPGTPLSLENDLLRADFDPTTGLLSSLTYKGGGGSGGGGGGGAVTIAVNHSLRYYVASNGTTGPYVSQGADGSGNYIFEPVNSSTFPMMKAVVAETTDDDDAAVVTVVTGPVVSEVRLVLQATEHGKVEMAYVGLRVSSQLASELVS